MSFIKKNITASRKTSCKVFLNHLDYQLLGVDWYLCMGERGIMPPLRVWRIISQVYQIYCYIQPELRNKKLISFKNQTYLHI